MDAKLLDYLYRLAVDLGGDLVIDATEITIHLPNPDLPKRQDPVPPWPIDREPEAVSSTTTTTWEPAGIPNPNPSSHIVPGPNPRHTVLNDMKQFLKEQEMNRLSRALYEDGKKQQNFRTGQMPYRNYPEGRPPR